LRKEYGENLILDERDGRRVLAYANNARVIEQEHEKSLKDDGEWHREQEQKEKQRIQEREEKIKRRQEYLKNLPQKQRDMILTGTCNRCYKCGATYPAEWYANHHPQCTVNTGEDLEPGLALIKQLHDTGRLMIFLLPLILLLLIF
jgi:exonuclease III